MAYGRADAVAEADGAGVEAVGADAAAGAARWFAEASCRGTEGCCRAEPGAVAAGADGVVVSWASSLAERNLSAQEA